jgi:hypothetical protein
MDEWVIDRMNEWVAEWKWINKWMKVFMYLWISTVQCTCIYSYKCLNVYVTKINEWILNERMNEVMSKGLNEWVTEWGSEGVMVLVKEWISKWMSVPLYTYGPYVCLNV